MGRRLVGTTLAVVAAAGCGGSSGNLQDYCRRGVEAVCSRFFACDAQAAAQQFGSESGCVTQLGGQCSSTRCTGGRTFDQSAADQCLAAYPSASCSELAQGIYPAVCSQVCK